MIDLTSRQQLSSFRPSFSLRALLYTFLLVAFYFPIVMHDLRSPFYWSPFLWSLFFWSLGTIFVVGGFLHRSQGKALPLAILCAILINLPFLPFVVWIVNVEPSNLPLLVHFCVLVGSQGFGIGGGIYEIHKGSRFVGWLTLVTMAISIGALFVLLIDSF